MDMTKLREAFDAWRKAETGQAVLAYNLMWLLTDPGPITEAGLRDLGYTQSLAFSSLWLSGDMPTVQKNRNGKWDLNGVDGYVASIGQLRGLLLSVGE
jgi:hypothetical protein